jgi:hypothetical protein
MERPCAEGVTAGYCGGSSLSINSIHRVALRASTNMPIRKQRKDGVPARLSFTAHMLKSKARQYKARVLTFMGNRLHYIQMVHRKLFVGEDAPACVHSALLYKSTDYNV